MRQLISAVLVLGALTLFPGAAEAQVDDEFEEVGAWLVRVSVDPMTDEETSFVVMLDDNDTGTMGFRCGESGFELMAITGFVGRDFSIRWRLGGEDPTGWSSGWGRSTNSRAVFATRSDRDQLFAGLPSVRRFTLQVRDQSGLTTLTFSDLNPDDTREALSHLGCAHDR